MFDSPAFFQIFFTSFQTASLLLSWVKYRNSGIAASTGNKDVLTELQQK